MPPATSLPKKLGIGAGSRVALVEPPPRIRELLLPWPDGAELVADPEDADVVLCFVRALAELESRFAALGEAIHPDGSLWICWPKRSSGVSTDLTDGAIRELLLPSGLVDTKVCAVDETWSGLRFVRRRALRFPRVHVEEIDARTAPDSVLARFHELELACHDELSPGEPARSRDEVIAFHRHQPTTHASALWLADGASAALFVHGPTAAFVHLRVHPERRRHGIGTALLERVAERGRELGVEVLRGNHVSEAGAAFARRVGAVDEQRVVLSVLDLRTAELPEPLPPEGWTLATWLGHVPQEHLAAYVVARAAMDDAPAPDEFDFPAWTAEKVRASEESLRQREREMRLTVAIAADGEVGAFSELRVSRGSTLAFTDDTGTVATHRGQGLARAVKVESLRRLREDHPEVEVVSTSNAEENAAMRHVNESVGFRPTVVETTAALRLS